MNIRSYVGRSVAVSVIATTAGFASAAPSDAALTNVSTQCTNLVVVGLRGSEQSFSEGSVRGFGTEVSGAATNMLSRIHRSGTYRFAAIPYAAKLKNKYGAYDLGTYNASVAEGASMTVNILNNLATSCGTRSKFVLIGYSQGAEVIRRAVANRSLSSTARKDIIAVGVIADPTRRGYNVSPSEIGYNEDFNTGTLMSSGLRGAGARYTDWLSDANNKVASFCQKADGVCNYENAGSLWNVMTGPAHTQFYRSGNRPSLIGLGLYTRLVHANFR